MKYKSFARKWSERFLKYKGGKMPRRIKPEDWCQELRKESAHCGWVRLVICTWDKTPFKDEQSLDPLIQWLEHTCMHPAFVKHRAFNSVSVGVQVWLSHQEDVAAFAVCVPDAVVHQRYMTEAQAQVDWINNWGTPFNRMA